MSKDYSELKAAEQAQSGGMSKSLYVGIPDDGPGHCVSGHQFYPAKPGELVGAFFVVPIAFIVANAPAIAERGRLLLDRGARATLVGAMFMFLLMLVFLFEMDWGKIWLAFLVISGLGFYHWSLGRLILVFILFSLPAGSPPSEPATSRSGDPSGWYQPDGFPTNPHRGILWRHEPPHLPLQKRSNRPDHGGLSGRGRG
ncbi:MAG: hypothetical protein H6651_07540 [Ardenticatenales bacterium]|nr:hypothetical protein [Ardenticatenales bacterium]